MKKTLINRFTFACASLVLCAVLNSCQDAGTTSTNLTGNEQILPNELKGLKVYRVATGDFGDYVKVAVLDGVINSTTYKVGKYNQSTIIVNNKNNKFIQVSEVLIENDSLVVCRK